MKSMFHGPLTKVEQFSQCSFRKVRSQPLNKRVCKLSCICPNLKLPFASVKIITGYRLGNKVNIVEQNFKINFQDRLYVMLL